MKIYTVLESLFEGSAMRLRTLHLNMQSQNPIEENVKHSVYAASVIEYQKMHTQIEPVLLSASESWTL